MRRPTQWKWWAGLTASTGGSLALLGTMACDPVVSTATSTNDTTGLLSGALLTLVVLLITD